MNELIKKLREPFPVNVVKWRVGATDKRKQITETSDKNAIAKSGIALAYITSRDVMKRLDDVMGSENWQDRYPYQGCCEIGLLIGDEWLWKSDGAGKTDIEGEKGQFSDAFKRAAVKWGIGRYLYYLPAEWVPLKNFGREIAQYPKLPDWAYPERNVAPETGFTQAQQKDYNRLLGGDSPIDFYLFIESLPVSSSVGLYNSFGKGEITKGKRVHDETMSKGEIMFNDMREALILHIEGEDSAGVYEVTKELNDFGTQLAITALTPDQHKVFKELKGDP